MLYKSARECERERERETERERDRETEREREGGKSVYVFENRARAIDIAKERQSCS